MTQDWTRWTDGTAIAVIIGSLIDFLPKFAALLAVIYWLIRIYETETVQKYLQSWRRPRK